MCGGQGHREKTMQCPFYEPHYADETVAFRSPMVFSNLYGCNIEYGGTLFNSVEQAYQFKQANTLGCTEIAAKIMDAKDGRDSMNIAKELPQSDAWDLVKLDVMKDLVKIKMDSCQVFRDALIKSGDKHFLNIFVRPCFLFFLLFGV